MSEISGGSEGDRIEQALPPDGSASGSAEELAEAMSPQLSPLADQDAAGVEAEPADVAEQEAELPVAEGVLHDTDTAGEASG